METTLNPCPALKPFIDYWDEWHKEWYANSTSKPAILNPIKGWEVPPDPIWQYFPEPYWGNPYTNNLVAVFLNINPGEGGDDQNIFHTPIADPFKTYLAQSKSYSRTVEILSANICFPTTNWFYDRRVNWLEKLLMSMKTTCTKKLLVENILCADLVPWHTKNVDTTVRNYIKTKTNQKLIIDNVIEPITEISQCAKFKGLVFAKGAEIEHLLVDKDKMNCTSVLYEKGDNRLRVCDYNSTKIFVFTGGQGMALPNPCDIYEYCNERTKLSIAEIVKKYKL